MRTTWKDIRGSLEIDGIRFDFSSTGWYDSGSQHYPPEEDDDRQLIKAYHINDDGDEMLIEESVAQILFATYYEQVQGVELDLPYLL